MTHNSRTNEWPETKRKLVDAGVSLMRLNGFDATTLDEVCESAKVTKGALFHYFDNKNDLAKAAITRFLEGKSAEFAAAPFRGISDPRDRVLARLDFVIESASASKVTRGCLAGMLAQEISFREPELRKECQEFFLCVAGDFEKDLAEAKAACPKAGFEPKHLAMLYVSTVQGSLILAKTTGSNRILIENLQQLRSYEVSLFPKPVGRGSARASAK